MLAEIGAWRRRPARPRSMARAATLATAPLAGRGLAVTINWRCRRLCPPANSAGLIPFWHAAGHGGFWLVAAGLQLSAFSRLSP